MNDDTTKAAGIGIGSIIAIAVFLLWMSGALDAQLAGAGLNREPCVQSYPNGSYYCGDAARQFCAQFGCDGAP
jgi:hypothetical protein